MTYRSYLVRKTPNSSYLLRIQIPEDLREYFGINQFKISLKNGIHSQSLLFAKVLYLEVQSIFSSVRMGTIPTPVITCKLRFCKIIPAKYLPI